MTKQELMGWTLHLLRQPRLPLRGACALTSLGLPQAGQGDLTIHEASVTNCTSYPTQDSTRAAAVRVTQPGSLAAGWQRELRAHTAASWPMELFVDALLPRCIRPY
jgi:hypothetical protein